MSEIVFTDFDDSHQDEPSSSNEAVPNTQANGKLILKIHL